MKNIFLIKNRNNIPVCYSFCNSEGNLDPYEIANEIGTNMEIVEWDVNQSNESAASILTATFDNLFGDFIGVRLDNSISKDLIYKNIVKESDSKKLFISFDISKLEELKNSSDLFIELACPEDSENYL